MSKKLFAIILLCTLIVSLLPSAAQAESGSVAELKVFSDRLEWQPLAPNAGLTLTLGLPSGAVIRRAFAAGVNPIMSLLDERGTPIPDGLYQYELSAAPILSDATRAALLAARQQGTEEEVIAALKRSGGLPTQALVQSGSFAILLGKPVLGGSEPAQAPSKQGTAPTPGTPAPLAPITPLDVVQADDLIVQGSACIGFDCVNNENFGFDTIRLKENNTRIAFDDTSVSAGFPANDWQIEANESASGGVSHLAILDVTNAKKPFRVIANSRNDALVLKDNRVGLGTSNPVLLMHMLNSDTPGIRLDQDNTSGWAPYVWDIAGNETNFFVRDVTGGSKLPFRIKPGAETNSIYISTGTQVGIGTSNPQERLHVNGNLLVEGYLKELSDRDAKQQFAPVDGSEVLQRLASIPVTSWSYKDDPAAGRHIGPTAQDFYAAYGFGADDKHIAPLDVNGVSLAAIQELNRLAQEKDARIQALEQKLSRLELGAPLSSALVGLLGVLAGVWISRKRT